MVTPIDKLMGIDCLKEKVDEQYKKAKVEAEEYLAYKRDTEGVTELTSVMFGADAGTYHYGKTKAKKEVEFNLTDDEDFAGWLEENQGAVFGYAKLHATDLAEWWFEMNGELADGVARVEHEIPPAVTPPKIYQGNSKIVKEKLEKHGGLFIGVSNLLLGDGNAD